MRERQHAAVARLGLRALAGADLQGLLDEAAEAVAEELSTDFSKILELLPGGGRLLVRAGVGWQGGYVGQATVEGGTGSQAGYTLVSGQPVVMADAATERRFALASLHRAHRITSGVTVTIPGRRGPFGILGVYTSGPRNFSQTDIDFLQSVANVLAAAIDRKRAEDERDALLREVQLHAAAARAQAQELQEVLDAFVSMAAHELKTPVAVMKGYAQALLRSRDSMPERGRRMLEAIDRGSDRIDRIVRDLLEISRFQFSGAGWSEQLVDLNALVRHLVGEVSLMSPRHDIGLLISGDALVWGDEERIEQLLSILLDNAVKYSPDGGQVEVTVGARDEDVVVTVSDQGIGIPLARQDRIFERFYRAHSGTPNDFGGMGIGLYIAREVARRHGGAIWFESQEGRGSSFHFSLPLAKDDESRNK